MLNYGIRNFICDAREKLDELAYGAHNLSGCAGLTVRQSRWLEQLSRELATFGDRMMMQKSMAEAEDMCCEKR